MPRIKRGLNRRSYGQTKDPRTFFFIASKHQLDSDNWVTDAFYTRASVLVRRILKLR